MTSTTKKNYKDTLNLPKTGFGMKANLAQSEPQSMQRWDAARLYEKVTDAREKAGAQPYVFHDGPPYANGQIHLGHMLNKVLKDLVVRTRLLMGKQCKYVPGWDCHGLPIEHKVMTELVKSGKAEKLSTLTEDQRRMAIRRECAKDAEKFVKLQAADMKRLLTLADYDHPYLTMAPTYEKAVLEVFALLMEQGLVYRALKPVHWSIANQTALAEAELEYEDREDPSIYVDFEALDREAVARAFGLDPDAEDENGEGALDQTPSFMVWTTTPWTLPANLAIAVHERYRYALVKVDGNVTVVAKDLVEKVMKVGKAESVEVIAETDGANLLGLGYRHPFCERTGTIVAAEYVTLEDGTGLVHTAPGHGEEDYRTGLREGLDIYCPVRDDGTYDDTVPAWLAGMNIWDANPLVVQHLEESGHLFHHHMFTHSYPHDWRSKKPVIFRSTEQWFAGVDEPTKREKKSLRAMAVEAAERTVQFVPEWGRNRLRGMLESRPDWCLSRQRAWGLPIPAFRLSDGSVFMTPASVRVVAAVIAAKGSDAWFTEPPAVLLAGYDAANDANASDAAKASAKAGFADAQKMYDIFDVWFESGSSWNAVMRERGLGYPCDLYLEGSDQHRGWFQLSLLPALGATGVPPFKTLLTHGFMVDKDGRKMSKSGGNALEVQELLKNFGADVCRWWVSSLAFENDIKVDLSFFEQAGEGYRKVRNTLRFLLSNLYDFDPAAHAVGGVEPSSIDAWALAEGAQLQQDVLEAYEKFEFRRANLALYDFCNDTLSAVYCAAVKDRLYCDRADSPRRRRTQTVMWRLSEMLCKLLAPIMPHTADEAYRSLRKDDAVTVHTETVQALSGEAQPDWQRVMTEREAWMKAVEQARQSLGIDNPLDCGVSVGAAYLSAFDPRDLADLCGVSRFELAPTDATATVTDLRNQPRCERSWKRDGTVKQRSDGGTLSDRDAEAVGLA